MQFSSAYSEDKEDDSQSSVQRCFHSSYFFPRYIVLATTEC